MDSYQNIATASNGCRVHDCSSEREKGECKNVLTTSDKEVWISAGRPPQHFVLDLTHLQQKPQQLTVFGLYCWHDYPSNPSLIELSYSQDARKFQPLGKFKCQCVSGWQYMTLPTNIADKARYFKVCVLENYGDDKTYINQVLLSADLKKKQDDNFQRFLPPEPKPRAKMASEHLKMTTTEKQLKRVSERVKFLQEQNQFMKAKMKQQSSTLSQMQSTIGLLVKNMEKMQRIIEDRYIAQMNDDAYQSDYIFQKGSQRQLPQAPYQVTESQSSKNRQKNSINYKAQSRKSRKNSESSGSDVSLPTEQLKIPRNEAINKTKILPLLEILQEKLTLKNRLQEKLMSPHRKREKSDRSQEDPYE